MNFTSLTDKLNQLKENGNNQFKQNQFSQAIQYFSQAIDLIKENHDVYQLHKQ